MNKERLIEKVMDRTCMNKITKYCKRCKVKFMYGNMDIALSGQMSRKYCDDCIILQSKDYSKNEYAKKKVIQ